VTVPSPPRGAVARPKSAGTKISERLSALQSAWAMERADAESISTPPESTKWGMASTTSSPSSTSDLCPTSGPGSTGDLSRTSGLSAVRSLGNLRSSTTSGLSAVRSVGNLRSGTTSGLSAVRSVGSLPPARAAHPPDHHQPIHHLQGKSGAAAKTLLARSVRRLHADFVRFPSKNITRTFAAELRLHYPRASATEMSEMLGFVAEKEAELALARDKSRTLSSAERTAVSDLFAVVDDDRSGTIDMREFEILAAGGVADVKMLKRAFRDTVGAEGTLDLDGFIQLMCELGLCDHVRKLLRLTRGARNNKLLVLDDGKQSVWRLVPGGPPMLIKPSRIPKDGKAAVRPSLADADRFAELKASLIGAERPSQSPLPWRRSRSCAKGADKWRR